MGYEDLPEEQWSVAGIEDINDSEREQPRETDGPLEKAARKYLKSRGRRLDIEFETESRIDAFPYRLAELFRAWRFTKLSGITFNNSQHMDEMLPTLARITLEETTPER